MVTNYCEDIYCMASIGAHVYNLALTVIYYNVIKCNELLYCKIANSYSKLSEVCSN